MSTVLLEARPFRPFKSSEEYLVAMKEDLAEWLQGMYPHLNICLDNFMEKLETGVALCEHANAVKAQAQEYVEKKQAKMIMQKSITGSLALAQNFFYVPEVRYFNTAKPGTFFARDNVSNFILWCRKALKIIECLLFESDDLIMRKNEKHVILCLLEVARQGAKFGMPAPMLVLMERQIDREIAADQKKLGVTFNENQDDLDDDSDNDMDAEDPVLMYGPTPQIITNDLKSLDEMVRDLVEKCTCPTQFPMIRVSEGKYRIGDTKVLIFVRILRNHVMVRVGGGWDTLSHYLDKHDPCRCRTQHRTTQSAKLVNKPGAADLHGSHVYYDRVSASAQDQIYNHVGGSTTSTLGPPMNSLNRSRSRSPTSYQSMPDSRRSVSPNFPRKTLMPPLHNRSRSPTPNYTSTYTAKLATNNRNMHQKNSGPSSLPIMPNSPNPSKKRQVASMNIPLEPSKIVKTETILHVNDTDHSDTTSEVSDEGYRSLGIIQDKSKQRSSLYSQNSAEDVDETEHHQVYTEDELNDSGLRKTKYSEKLYVKNRPEHNSQITEKLSPTETNEDCSQHDFHTTKPKEYRLKQKEKSFSLQNEKTPSSPQPSRIRKANSFVDEKPPSRAQSVELKNNLQTSPRKTNGQMKKDDSKIGTWNGRPKNTRKSLSTDQYDSPFTRNTTGRRSMSAGTYDRRTSSTNSSPKKSALKQEFLQAVKHVDDDENLLKKLTQLLKKHGSLSALNDDEETVPAANNFSRNSPEFSSFRSPRKDSKVHNNLSKIPAPVFYGKT